MKKKAFKAALPYTLPICVGFLFLGMSYGFLMRSKGFSFWYPLFMSMFIYAGSMEFVTANLLLSAFNPLYAFLLALMVNARHLFYGISMLDKYKNVGWKKFYLIYGMCDESFSINCTTEVPEGKKSTGVYQISWNRTALCSDRTSGCFLPERCTGKYHLRHPGTAGNYLYLQLFNG